MGISVKSVEMTRKLDLGAAQRLASILHDERVQLLHTHLAHASYLGRRAAGIAETPCVISTVHVVERRFRPWHYWADRLTSHRADVEICVSEAVREHTARAVPEVERLVAERELRDPESQERLEIEARIRTQIGRWTRAMEALGVEVKGLWLVDFDNGSGYYCWKWPEEELAWFHGYDEGFAGRVRIQ